MNSIPLFDSPPFSTLNLHHFVPLSAILYHFSSTIYHFILYHSILHHSNSPPFCSKIYFSNFLPFCVTLCHFIFIPSFHTRPVYSTYCSLCAQVITLFHMPCTLFHFLPLFPTIPSHFSIPLTQSLYFCLKMHHSSKLCIPLHASLPYPLSHPLHTNFCVLLKHFIYLLTLALHSFSHLMSHLAFSLFSLHAVIQYPSLLKDTAEKQFRGTGVLACSSQTYELTKGRLGERP